MRPLGINAFVQVPQVVDPYWGAVIFATHADGPNGQGNNIHLDSSPTHSDMNTVSRPLQGSFSPYASGGGSATFLGAEAIFMNAGNASVALGVGDYTIECWVFPTPTSGSAAIAATGGTGGWQFVTTAGGIIGFYKDGGAAGVETAAGQLAPNVWTHLAVTRVGTTLTLWRNGVSIGTGVDASNYTLDVVHVGQQPSNIQRFNGSICDFRIVKGTAIYTAPFTPPTTPLAAVAGTGLLLSETNAALVDATRKANGKTVNVNTNAGQTKFGAGSIFSQDGTANDGAFFPNVNNLYALGTGDFTFECWLYPQDLTGARILWDMRAAAGAYPTINVLNGTVTYVANGAQQITGVPLVANVWTHIAVCRIAGQTRLFQNGVQVGSTYADATNYLCGPLMGIGGFTFNPTLTIKGYIDDVRITKGIGRYAANFAPPTQAFPDTSGSADPFGYAVSLLLHGDGVDGANNLPFLDSGPNAYAMTRAGDPTQGAASPYAAGGGSGWFDGTGDYLTVASDANLALGAGDFTIEFWVWPVAFPAVAVLYDTRPLAQGAYPTIYYASGGLLTYFTGSADRIVGGAVTTGVWHHIAVSRVAGTTRLFLDGVLQGSPYADANNYLAAASRPIVGSGGLSLGSDPYNGLVSDVRVLKGTGLYTANFTRPSEPLTAVANTQLLAKFTNGKVIDSARKKDLKLFGTTALSTAQSKFGGASIRVPGAGAGVVVPGGADMTFGTGDFTLECWLYPTSLASSGYLFDFGTGGGRVSPVIYVATNGQIVAQMTGAGQQIQSAAGAVAINNWYHFAMSRVSGQCRMFLNGVQVGATYADAANIYVAQPVIGIGVDWSGTSLPSNGYFDDVRITKGVGRYTANFAVPTAPFPNP